VTELRNKTVRGAGWMALSQIISQIARIGFMIALARLLTPEEFGLWGMALVFIGFAALLGDVGLGAALIQRSVIEPRHLDTVFWINLGLGLVLMLLMIAGAKPLSAMYGAPQLAPLLAIASTEFVIKSVSGVHRVLLVRDMNFRAMAIQETVAMVIAGTTACLLAASGWGAWSLVAQNLIIALTITVWMMQMHPWRPSLRFDPSSLRELLHFSLHLQAFNLLNYWLRNLDKFLIGRMLGEASLGYYNRAYTTMLLPQSQITGTLERVMWPALARCAHDPARLRDAYLRTLRIICLVSFPFMIGLAATAHDFVVVVFGATWEPSVAPLQWLCIAGFLQTPISTLGWLYLASGRTKRLLVWSVTAACITIPAMIIGAMSGSIDQVAIWYAGSSVIIAPLAFIVAAPIAALSLRHIATSLGGSAAAALVMGATVVFTAHQMPDTEPAARLIVSIALGIATYAVLAFKTKAATEAWDVVVSLKQKIPSPGIPEPTHTTS
jgi:O-antigen/teichoic acid export membrane protein